MSAYSCSIHSRNKIVESFKCSTKWHIATFYNKLNKVKFVSQMTVENAKNEKEKQYLLAKSEGMFELIKFIVHTNKCTIDISGLAILGITSYRRDNGHSSAGGQRGPAAGDGPPAGRQGSTCPVLSYCASRRFPDTNLLIKYIMLITTMFALFQLYS